MALGDADGVPVRTRVALQFNGAGGVFEVPAGEGGVIVDNEETRAYTRRWKGFGSDLVPVRLRGLVRYVDRRAIQVVR